MTNWKQRVMDIIEGINATIAKIAAAISPTAENISPIRICSYGLSVGYWENKVSSSSPSRVLTANAHSRYFYKLLPTCPKWQIQRREKVNLLIDGTYFTNKVCLRLYRDNNIKMTILYRLTKGETLRDLKEDLQNIKQVGIQIESVTCDGAANILKAVREVCPETVLQRCTFHIAHEIQIWLTKKPKSEAARELLDIVRYLNRVETNEDAQLWMRAFIDWYREYEEFIKEKSYDELTGRWWYKHKLLHRSATHIKRALPDMFSFTRYDNIPKTSNSIESFFGQLKDHLRLHRGLSEQHFQDFVK